MRTLTLVLLAACTCSAQQKGSISGSVVSTTGEPLRSVTLRLQGQITGPRPAGTTAPPVPQAYAASTDAQGNFTFSDLDPARYSVTAQKAGYLPGYYSTTSNGSSSLLDLTSGQSLTGIAIKMTPQGAITGVITDENGDPVPNARVMLARWGYSQGRKRLMQMAGGSSDFEGVYSVGNLTAGSYILSVVPSPNFGLPAAKQKGPEESYATTYYPGVTEPSAALALQVAAGAVLRSTNVRIRKAPSFRVRGKVSGALAGAVQLLPKNSLDTFPLGINLNSNVREGTFEIAGVLPGVYVLQMQSANGPRNSGSAEMGRQEITVGNADVDDIVLQLGPGADITGKISIDGPPPPASSQNGSPQPGANIEPGVMLTDLSGQGGGRGQGSPNGTFELHHIMPSVYQVQVQPLPPGMYVKAIRFGSQDLTKSMLDLSSGSGGVIDVTLSPNVADISGVVHGSDGSPVVGGIITLWTPGVPSTDSVDFTRTARTDDNGQFKLPNLPPGNYRVAAWEQVDQGLAMVPEFRMKFEGKAVAVTLNENDHAQIQPELISRDASQAEAAKFQ